MPQRILALAADIPLTDRLDSPQATVRKRAPLCGSTVTVDLDMEGGRIVEIGDHETLMAQGGRYRELVEHQLEGTSGSASPDSGEATS